MGRPRGFGMNISSSLGSGVDKVLVGLGSDACWRSVRAEVKGRASGCLVVEGIVSRLRHLRHIEEAVKNVRCSGIAIRGWSMLCVEHLCPTKLKK
jgi:hypothetical protein